MSNIVNTKNRLSSTKSTQKVINAMKLVASSKIKSAREKAQNIRFYYDTTIDSMNSIFSYTDIKDYLNVSEDGKTIIFAINSDMGLCGSFNANINKKVLELVDETSNYEIIAAGSKLVNKLTFEKVEMLESYKQYSSKNEIDFALEITDLILKKFNEENIKSIKIVYTKFINALVQEVEVVELLDFTNIVKNDNKIRPTLIVEPDRETVFKQLFKQMIISIIYTSILQSFASEHSYRRNAMDNANTNSLELIDKLNLELNRIRQANITQEISEIIGGSEALKKG